MMAAILGFLQAFPIISKWVNMFIDSIHEYKQKSTAAAIDKASDKAQKENNTEDLQKEIGKLIS